ncbi:MAG TPA: serine hydrolase domain-containing protein [Allosphingosinicella sp.]|nr:serine hydrolase domain-containing protein [Allosphingosinicella sp.]
MLTGRFLRGAFFAAAAVSVATLAAAAPPADLRARADAIVAAAFPADGPGGAVIISRGGETIYRAGRGLADVEARRPATPDSVFRLGSLTKQFTAAVVLQLVQEGRIALDDPVSRFFPDYPQPGAAATVRQLLNHTSGIQSYTGIPGWMVEENTNRPYTTAEMIALFRDRPSPTPPGQAWAYNNSGYVLLGAIVEKVTGRPWHRAVAERIAGPLHLATIGYGVDRESGPAMARGYTQADGQVRPAQRIHMSVPHAAGALVGTVDDLARWSQALHHARVVSPALYTAMTSPTVLPEGRSQAYGFGLRIGEERGRATIEHGGGIFGFNTYATYIPSDDLFVAVLANSDAPASPPGLITARLIALALGDPYPEFTRAEVDPRTLAPLFGVYRVGDAGVSRRFFARDGKLYTTRDGGADLEVFAAGGDLFFYGPSSLTWFRIERRPDGAHVMEMHQNGGNEAERAVRTGDVPPEPAAAEVSRDILESYVGHYVTPGPAIDIAMGEGGVLTVRMPGDRAFPLRPASATEFIVQGINDRIVFHSENGQVNRLVIHQNGRELEGRRAPR